MRRSRWFLLAVLVVIAVVASWLWWFAPRKVDMAAYAPADSLIYLESNHPLDVVKALKGTEAWRILDNLGGTQPDTAESGWLIRFIGFTGIGPIESVILARAQVAVVVTDLGATEEADTLRIKPEGALIIETQMPESRIRSAAENAVKKLAERTYGKPVFRRTSIDGADLIEWIAPEGSRQIVANITGSLVIVGNTQQAVRNCLAVSQGRRSSLQQDAGLRSVRVQLDAEHALSLGYVPAANSARLLSVGVPLLFGRAPANSEFQRLIATGATKVFGSLGWSSRPMMTGIEDRFLISLQPGMLSRLKPHFIPTKLSSQMPQILPADVHSATNYKFENAAGAWQGLKTAVSSQVDAFSAIVFSSLLKSALLSYGIEEPEIFLTAASAEILTFRLGQNSDRSMLIARVRDEAKLRELFSKTLRLKSPSDGNGNGGTQVFEDAGSEFAASFVNGFVVVGSPNDVRRYAAGVGTNMLHSDPDKLKQMTFFVPLSNSASIVTYADDSDRVKSFLLAILAARGATAAPGNRMDQMVDSLPYSATETSLGEHGLERTTRSPLGQFSTLLPLLVPEQRAP